MALENVCPHCCSTVLRMEKDNGMIKWYCMKCHKRSDMLKTIELDEEGQMSKEAYDEVTSKKKDKETLKNWSTPPKKYHKDLRKFYKFNLSTFSSYEIWKD